MPPGLRHSIYWDKHTSEFGAFTCPSPTYFCNPSLPLCSLCDGKHFLWRQHGTALCKWFCSRPLLIQISYLKNVFFSSVANICGSTGHEFYASCQWHSVLVTYCSISLSISLVLIWHCILTSSKTSLTISAVSQFWQIVFMWRTSLQSVTQVFQSSNTICFCFCLCPGQHSLCVSVC